MPNSYRFWIAWGQLVDAITNIMLLGHGTQLSYSIARGLVKREQARIWLPEYLQ